MRTLLLIGIVATGFMTAACSSLPPAGVPYSGKPAKVNVADFGYVYTSYQYSQKPIGFNRYFGLTISPQASETTAPFRVEFADKDRKTPVLYRLIPGEYQLDSVDYFGYSFQSLGWKFTVEPGKVYYLGNVEIVNVKKSNMTSTGVFTNLVDMMAASTENWDYHLTDRQDVDEPQLAKLYPEVGSFPVVKVVQ